MPRKTKKPYYNNLDIEKATDNKIFCNAFFKKRLLKGKNINFIENGKNISHNTE